MIIHGLLRMGSGLLLILAFTMPLASEISDADPFSTWTAGPFYSRFKLTLEEGERTEILGPLFHQQTTPETREWGVSPLFSYLNLEETDRDHIDILYPLMTFDRIGQEKRFQIFQLLSFSAGQKQSGNEARRLSLFPFYFHQRSEDSEENYTALFPVHGRIKNRFLRDEIRFTAFPIYSQSKKKGVVTDNVFYPIFHLRKGDHVEGWQVWPFVGYESREPVSVIDDVTGEAKVVPGYRKRFFLWPIVLQEDGGLGTDIPRKQRAVLPFYYRDHSSEKTFTSVLWPFFNYTIDHAQDYREWGFPWPFFSVAKGEGKESIRFWPIYGKTRVDTLTGTFFAWPLYRSKFNESQDVAIKRSSVFFYLYNRREETNKQSGQKALRILAWPFLEYRREMNGDETVQFPALLEPLLPGNKSIKRNWSPLWSLWRAEENVLKDTRTESLLWNFYRRERRGEETRMSVLFGLLHFKKDSEGSRLWMGVKSEE